MARVWQIAAGDAERDYSKIFIDHDVMFMGPGEDGEFTSRRYRELVEAGRLRAYTCNALALFHGKVNSGDIVLLRQGYRVVSIGLVDHQGYSWNPRFADVHGWDLQHTRRVVWQDHLCAELDRLQAQQSLFKDRKQIPTFTRVKDRSILERIEYLFKEVKERELRSLPLAIPDPLSFDGVGQELFRRGVANSAVDHVIESLQRQRRLMAWYRTHGKQSGRPDEHEVVAHMVLPLLLALGWSEQLLAIEWHKIDLAGFWTTPTGPQNCVLVCEAKKIGHGMGRTKRQAFQYVKDLELTGCQKVLVTEGGRFYVYERDGKHWRDVPSGYFNVEQIRTQHLVPACTNAIDTMVSLTPAGVSRPIGAGI